ncbi:MAG: hypothetical protein GWP05_00170 [Anaerolineaceae bacterium]|nr:hypothetical protein [Anaerolineaceae bacterium]
MATMRGTQVRTRQGNLGTADESAGGLIQALELVAALYGKLRSLAADRHAHHLLQVLEVEKRTQWMHLHTLADLRAVSQPRLSTLLWKQLDGIAADVAQSRGLLSRAQAVALACRGEELIQDAYLQLYFVVTDSRAKLLVSTLSQRQAQTARMVAAQAQESNAPPRGDPREQPLLSRRHG